MLTQSLWIWSNFSVPVLQSCIQQQKLGGPVPESLEGADTVGDGGKVVSKTGTTVRAPGMLYKAFLQSVLCESWLVIVEMLKVLDEFSSSGKKKDYGNIGAPYNRRGVGVPPSG